ncbi:hypothetical protein VKT23_011502 [Stygiomarasmius scandens]|uniref:Uncharacterized protein n=1 Tax=Marasmiellus scandens TaxID=2682957 RepID=A0ABR1JB01_9AGAR
MPCASSFYLPATIPVIDIAGSWLLFTQKPFNSKLTLESSCLVMSAVTKLGLQKQVSWTRPRPNSDIHATGVLPPRFSRIREQGTANALDAEVDPAGPFHTSPRLTAEAATTSSPASNSTPNDPTDPFRTILNHSQNPNFTHSVLSNVNGNSTTSSVTNHYNYYVSGNLRVSPSELHPLREDEVPSAPNAQRVNKTPSPSGIPNVVDVGTPVSDGDSENHGGVQGSRPGNNPPVAKLECAQENILLDSDGSRYVVIEARLTLPLETFELKTVIPFFFLPPPTGVVIVTQRMIYDKR